MKAEFTKPPESSGTSQRILDVAEHLAQTRGFNGFSYADIATALGVTKASLHYHFPSKAELGRRLIERYRDGFRDSLHRIDATSSSASERLEGYVAIYERVLGDGRMCLCGMLAAEYTTLPEPMRDGIARFFEANESWVAAVLENGRAAGEFDFEGDAREAANTFIGALEGIMLLARTQGGPARFVSGARLLIANFSGARPKRSNRRHT